MALHTTTEITITLSDDVLTNQADVTINDVGDTGAQKNGALENVGAGVYKLPIAFAGVTKQPGNIEVSLAKDGYTFNPPAKTVAVNYIEGT